MSEEKRPAELALTPASSSPVVADSPSVEPTFGHNQPSGGPPISRDTPLPLREAAAETVGTPAADVQPPATAAFPFSYDASSDLVNAQHAAARRNLALNSSGTVEPIPPPQNATDIGGGLPPHRVSNADALSSMRESMRSAPLASSSGAQAKGRAELTLTPAPPKIAGEQSTEPRRVAQTVIGAAVLQNSESILLSAAGLLIQIEEKLATLRQERWNSEESQTACEAAIANYEELKQKVEAFLDVAARFLADVAEEKDVVKSATSFHAALTEWWNKRHTEIFDLGLFVSALGVCTMMGANGVVVATICGALAGGNA